MVAALALLGTACEPPPKPPLQLTITLDQSATYDVLTKAVALRATVTCTRPAKVYLTEADLVVPGSGPVVLTTRSLDPYTSANAAPVDCPGPGGGTGTSWWHWTGEAPDTGGYTIWLSGSTFGLLGPSYATAQGAGTVHFSKVLCWFGLSSPCAPA